MEFRRLLAAVESVMKQAYLQRGKVGQVDIPRGLHQGIVEKGLTGQVQSPQVGRSTEEGQRHGAQKLPA